MTVEHYDPDWISKSHRKKDCCQSIHDVIEEHRSDCVSDASDILREAATLIESRAVDRDVDQERSMAVTVELFFKLTGIQVSEYNGWLFMACLKLARNRVGTGVFNRDHLMDAMAYLALALESTDG